MCNQGPPHIPGLCPSENWLGDYVKEIQTAADAFHAHLDVCAQCHANPFDLCAQGEALLKRASGAGDPGANK